MSESIGTLPTLEVVEESQPRPRDLGRRVLASVGLGLSAATLAAGAYVSLASTDAEVAGNRVTIEPSLDGHATADLGGISARIAIDTPGHVLGAHVTLHEGLRSPTELADGYMEAKTWISALADIENIVKAQYMRAGLWGLGSGLLAGGILFAAWPGIDREKLRDYRLSPRQLTAVAAVASMSVGFATSLHDTQVEPAPWVSPLNLIPQEDRRYVDRLDLPAEIELLQIRGPANLSGQGGEEVRQQASKFIKKNIKEPQQFADNVTTRFAALAAEAPAKPAGAYRVGVLSDVHDNVFMAGVYGAAFKSYGVNAVVVAGDTTGVGSGVEAFSNQAIADATSFIQDRVYVKGNHDTSAAMKPFIDAGFVELQKGQINQIGPLRATGEASNTYTPLNGPNEVLAPAQEVAAELADTACTADTRVNLVVTHQPWLAQEALEQGCADVAVYGHMHQGAAPEKIEGDNGTVAYGIQNGTSGGAQQFITIGKPQQTAESTFIDYLEGEDGAWRPVSATRLIVQMDGSVEQIAVALEPTVTAYDLRQLAELIAKKSIAPQIPR